MLQWIKQEVINNHTARIYLTLDRSHGKVETRIISDSDELETRLQAQFDEKITHSPVLTQWKENQEEGFKLDNPQCAYLTIRMSMLELLTMTEQMELQQKNVDKNQPGDKKKFKGFFL